MRPGMKSLLTPILLLLSLGLWAQGNEHIQKQHDSSYRPDLLARLSYSSSLLVGGDLRQACIAISRDASYRIVRVTNKGESQRLQGEIPKKQFEQLKMFLSDSDFRALSGFHGGLVLQSAETFGAEVFRDNSTQRVQWLDADSKSPFPDSLLRVVDWLKDFEPKNGKNFQYAEFPDVCPSVGVRLIQPSIATNIRH
jgi:hypothetical protein